MTQLSFIFPCLAGILKVATPALSQHVIHENEAISSLWLSLLISLGFASLSMIHIVFILAASSRKLDISSHIQQFKVDISRNPWVLITLSNGFLGSFDLYSLCYLAAKTKPSVAMVLLAWCQGQFMAALILDVTGIVWVPRGFPKDSASVGGSFLFLGTVMILMYPLANIISKPTVVALYFAGFGVGILSFITHALTRRLSYACISYLVGTLIAAFGQCLVLTCLCCGLDPRATYIQPILGLFNSTGLAAMFICVAFSLFVQSVSMQWFGDKKGFFATAGPVLSGQAVLSSCLEMAGRIPRFEATTDYVKFSGSTLTALILISIGSLMMWMGQTSRESRASPESNLPNRNQL